MLFFGLVDGEGTFGEASYKRLELGRRNNVERGLTRGGRGVEVEQGADVSFICAGYGVAFVDERKEE